jgi:excisionase family DNA binding protein
MSIRFNVSVQEAARRLGVHPNTIRNWESQGLLMAIRLPGSGYRRFSVDEVERLREQMVSRYAPSTRGPEEELGHDAIAN